MKHASLHVISLCRRCVDGGKDQVCIHKWALMMTQKIAIDADMSGGYDVMVYSEEGEGDILRKGERTLSAESGEEGNSWGCFKTATGMKLSPKP